MCITHLFFFGDSLHGVSDSLHYKTYSSPATAAKTNSMKKNHSTTKSLTRKYLPVIISVIIIAVLISSCCVPEEARVGKTNCNCTDKKYAVTKEPAYNYTQAALVLTDNNEIRDAIKPAV